MTNRRMFIKQTSALSLLSLPFQYSMGRPSEGLASAERLSLEEPGPMIPPVPAILLTVNGRDGQPEEISVVWTFVVNGKPPQIGISVENVHVALELIKHHGEFVLNVPTADMIKSFDRVDMNSTKVFDKFELAGFTRDKAHSMNAPVIRESPIHVECRVIRAAD